MSDGVRAKVEAIEVRTAAIERSQIRMEDKLDFLINARLEDKKDIWDPIKRDVDMLKHWRTALSAGFAAVIMWVQHRGGKP